MAPGGTVPAYVIGVGLTKFLKPRRTREYPELGYEAGVKVLQTESGIWGLMRVLLEIWVHLHSLKEKRSLAYI